MQSDSILSTNFQFQDDVFLPTAPFHDGDLEEIYDLHQMQAVIVNDLHHPYICGLPSPPLSNFGGCCNYDPFHPSICGPLKSHDPLTLARFEESRVRAGIAIRHAQMHPYAVRDFREIPLPLSEYQLDLEQRRRDSKFDAASQSVSKIGAVQCVPLLVPDDKKSQIQHRDSVTIEADKCGNLLLVCRRKEPLRFQVINAMTMIDLETCIERYKPQDDQPMHSLHRTPNAFIIYRSCRHKEIAPFCQFKAISGCVAKLWQAESQEVKDYFGALANAVRSTYKKNERVEAMVSELK